MELRRACPLSATDAQWKNDPGRKNFFAFMEKYFPEGDKTNSLTGYDYSVGQTMAQVLKQCGDNLTRENVMKQAASLKELQQDLFLPGIKANTSSTDFYPLDQNQMMRFTGERWEYFGPVMTGATGS